MMELFQLFFLLGGVINSMQAHYPTCNPSIAESSLPPTLLVLVFDHAIGAQDKEEQVYFIKQLVCSIPISPAIKTFFIDPSVNNTGLVIGEGSFYDSKKLGDEIFVGYEKTNVERTRCRRFMNTLTTLATNPFIKAHSNAHFIIPTFDPTCPIPDLGNIKFFSVNFLARKNGKVQYLTMAGQGDIIISNMFAPKHLVKTTDALVNHMLHFNDNKIVDECPACNCSDSEGCTMKWLIGIGTVVISFVYLAIIVIWVRN